MFITEIDLSLQQKLEVMNWVTFSNWDIFKHVMDWVLFLTISASKNDN